MVMGVPWHRVPEGAEIVREGLTVVLTTMVVSEEGDAAQET
jgi:hypothetical protein